MATVFVRNWYKRESGRLVPDPHARKTIIQRGVSAEEAHTICQDWNRLHNPGPLSRKAEWMS
jgi:hypothetical protein